MRMLPVPSPGELRELPVVHKSKAQGARAWCVFTFLRVLRWLGNEWATTVYEDFKQHIGGVIYWFDDEPSLSLRDHESVHEWQSRRFWPHGARYLLSKKYRRHAEAMAYAFEVVVHSRSPEERASVAAHPVYKLGWTQDEARSLIGSYAVVLRAFGWRETWT